ncbi:MAG TPA: hypothetical protein VLS88_13605 [Polyangiales bacterium]|nr:hypothetical protein [Polyangiales bacterium]
MTESSNPNDGAPRAGARSSTPGPQTIRSLLVAIVALGALVLFAMVLHHHYPIQRWLFWKYATAALLASFWLLSCVSAGLAIVQRLLPELPMAPRLIQASSVGVLAFYLLQFLGGIVGLFGPVWSIALPVVMLGAGLLGSRESLRELWRSRPSSRGVRFTGAAWWQVPIVLYGAACLVGLYLSILTPNNANFDAQWYHLGLGQGWAADGAILRTPEGWFVEALPNMAAVLYSWAFLLPGLDLFDITMVAAHQELALFLVTLAGIPVLVRWLLPDTNAAVAWVALFLFPSVFIYDASLHSGNDHVAAFWAVPIFLALTGAWERLDWRNMLLLTVGAAGALLTKYQAASLITGPALFILGRAVYLGFTRRGDSTWMVGLGVAAAASLVLTAPHWAKNWLWYGDPLFPALHKHLTPRPWNEDMPWVVENAWSYLVRRPEGGFFAQLEETLKAGFNFSFRSFTKGRFHGNWPYFGSLFTLSLAWLPFVRGAKRTWALALAAQLGVFTWYYLTHVERYLQALIPWMASVVVAALVLAWRTGWLARLPILALVALQVIWGGDAFFFRSHAMLRDLPLIHTARLVESGFKGNWRLRERVFDPQQTIGDKLPPGSTILLHGYQPRLGYRAQVVVDQTGFQSRIRYGLLDSPQEVHALYEDMGIDYVVWSKSKGSDGRDTIAGELRFNEFVYNAIRRRSTAGGFYYGALPEDPPKGSSSNVVLYAGCGGAFKRGFFRLRDMNVPNRQPRPIEPFEPMPEDETALAEAMRDVSFVVYDPKCKKPGRPPGGDFFHAADHRGEQLWIRRWR